MATQPTEAQPQKHNPQKRFPLTSQQLRTLADEFALASTLLRAVATQLDQGKQLDDPQTMELWYQFSQTLEASGMRTSAYHQLIQEAAARGEYP